MILKSFLDPDLLYPVESIRCPTSYLALGSFFFIIYGLFRQINGIKNIAVADIMQGNVFRKSALLIFYNFSVT